MKKIFKYFGVLLTVALMGAFTACTPEEPEELADLGLKIKAVFPTKVVPGAQMTINGSGLADVKEIVFPDNIVVTNFKRVGHDMIRVNVPNGFSSAGGKLIVRTEEEEAEYDTPLTLGKTVITGFSKQAGESIKGGEQITIFGQDLEFINSVELLGPDGNPYIMEDTEFYRKGTNSVIITIPRRNIYTGSFAGRIFTVDGKEFLLPELAYEPNNEGGHMEIVRKTIWKNDGTGGEVSWSGQYRFAGEGFGTGEEIAIIPTDMWNFLKTETFYIDVAATDPQIRVTTGWWSGSLDDKDFQPGNDDRLVDNGDGTFTLEVNLSNASFKDLLDEQHLLFTGDRFTLLEIYYTAEEWKEGEEEGHWETVKDVFWTNEGGPEVSWSGTYRFAGEGFETGEEIAILPSDIWAKVKSETFFLRVAATDPQIRVTTGWWSGSLDDKDFQPGNDDRLVDNGDGTWTLEINLTDASFKDLLDEQHLLFTGDRFTPIELYFEKQEWQGGGGHMEIVKTPVWTNDGSGGAVSWSGQYRFAVEGHETGEEIAIIAPDVWDKLKSETFYIDVEATDPQIRVTSGWWSVTWTGADIQPGNELLTDNGDGTWTLEVNLSGEADLLAVLDEQHLLFTGDRYTLLQIYFQEEKWVGGGGGAEPKEVVIWEGDGSAGTIAWSGTYRFAGEGFETGEEIAIIPADTWAKMKSSPFYMKYVPDDPTSYQIRVTTGWWSVQWLGGDNDIAPWNLTERINDNGDGSYYIKVDFSEDPAILDSIDEQHLLFTGNGYKPMKIYFLE